jgi:hypothetical protein
VFRPPAIGSDERIRTPRRGQCHMRLWRNRNTRMVESHVSKDIAGSSPAKRTMASLGAGGHAESTTERGGSPRPCPHSSVWKSDNLVSCRPLVRFQLGAPCPTGAMADASGSSPEYLGSSPRLDTFSSRSLPDPTVRGSGEGVRGSLGRAVSGSLPQIAWAGGRAWLNALPR